MVLKSMSINFSFFFPCFIVIFRKFFYLYIVYIKYFFVFVVEVTFFDFFVVEIYAISTHSYALWRKKVIFFIIIGVYLQRLYILALCLLIWLMTTKNHKIVCIMAFYTNCWYAMVFMRIVCRMVFHTNC